MMRRLLAVVLPLSLLTLMGGGAPMAQEEPAVNIGPHMDRIRDELPHSERFRPGQTDFTQWQRRLRKILRERLGVPAQTRRLIEAYEGPMEEVEMRGLRYRRQRVLLQTEPDLWVPAYLCLPLAANGRLPAVIGCQGHAKDGIKLSVGLVSDAAYAASITNGDRDYPLQAVRHGYAGFALEMRGFGELRLAEDIEKDAGNSCPRLQSLAIQAGRTLIGMRVHDIMAAVEYLQQRPDINPKQIALTGNSGGGTVTLYAAALDERIAASIPSCAFCTYADSIQAVPHCPCNFVPGLSVLIEMDDLAGLAAPRPQLIVAGKEDTIFPVDGVREAFGRLERIYEAAGAKGKVQLYVGEGGHRYYAEPVWPFLGEVFGRGDV
jgi:dienelactone hydrolase